MKQDYFKMKICFIVGTLLLVCGTIGVSSPKDELKSVSVMEGDSVTLHTDVTEIQRDDQILWMFGPQKTQIAEINKRVNSSFIYHGNDGRFKDKLQLDDQTGSLIIRNIRIKHSGLYYLKIFSNRGTSYKIFNVTVCARLPVPIITRDSNESSSKCVLLCSVENVTHVTLSWYKGNSSFSNISVSDLNNSLSLPLDVECQENNTYSCVVSNPICNQIKHLNITEVCQMCSVSSLHSYLTPGIIVVVAVVAGVLLVIIGGLRRRSSKRWFCDSVLHYLFQSHRDRVPEMDSLSTTEP